MIGTIKTRDHGFLEIVSSGEIIPVEKVIINELYLEGKSAKNIPAYVLNTRFPVIVGINALKKLGLMKDINNGMMFYY